MKVILVAFVYEKIPEEEKQNLQIKFNKIKEIAMNNTNIFYNGKRANYEFPKKWTIDKDNNYILIKCGSYDPPCPPLGVYSVQTLFVKDYIIMIEVFDEEEGPGWVNVTITKICAPKELECQESFILKIIEDAFKVTWVNKESEERFDPDDIIESEEDVRVYYFMDKIKFVL